MKDYSVLWAGDHISVISPDGAPYEAVYEPDAVHVIPVDVKTSEVFIRREVCPPYTVRDTSDYSHFRTIVSGGIDEGETPEEAAIREVNEELGIDLSKAEYELVPLTPQNIPFTKNTVSRVTLFALMLFSYKISDPDGDGTPYEELSTFERIPLQQLDDALMSDQCDLLLHAAVSKLKCFILLDKS
jgi:8-oxo-dGTP pyrophosphatase MutT (NUDIX family)